MPVRCAFLPHCTIDLRVEADRLVYRRPTSRQDGPPALELSKREALVAALAESFVEAVAAVFLRETRAKAGKWAQGAGGLSFLGASACLPACNSWDTQFTPSLSLPMCQTVALAFLMAALLAYLASLKLWVLRRRHHAAPARAPAPEGSAHCNAAKHKQPKEAIDITATTVASVPLPQNGAGGVLL